jgi:type IV pilus assembly protein PilM
MTLAGLLQGFKGAEIERMLGLRPSYPQVAVALDRDELCLVRIKRRRRGPPVLEAHHVERVEQSGLPPTIFEQSAISPPELAQAIRRVYASAGVNPTRISLVLPDNLAKIALLTLPERPASRQQLLEMVRFKMRRAVPFRLSEAALSFQVLDGEQKNGVTVLVGLTRQTLIDQYEQAFKAVGTRVGLIDLCTPNLLNLCRSEVEAASAAGDVALLNCTASYFSIAIVRASRLIFFRCKSYMVGDDRPGALDTLLARELAGSFSYYQDKLSGQGIGAVLVRSVAVPFEELASRLSGMGIASVIPLDPTRMVAPSNGARLDAGTAQRIAPALGAAAGRS